MTPFFFLIAACAAVQLLGSQDYLHSTFLQSGDPFPKIFLTAISIIALLVPKEEKWGKTASTWFLVAFFVGLAHGIFAKSLLRLWFDFATNIPNVQNLRVLVRAVGGTAYWTVTHISIWGVSRWGAITSLLVLLYEKIKQ